MFEKLIDLWPLPQASLSLLLGDTHHCIVERLHITEALEPQEFKDGAVLIKQGEPRDAFFIIVQGELSCTQRRDRRCEDGPPAPPFWSASARPPALQHARRSARGYRQGYIRAWAREPERHHKAPWRLAASNAAICATATYIFVILGPAKCLDCALKTILLNNSSFCDTVNS